MERGRTIETTRNTLDIRSAVLRLRRLHNLSDVFEMMEQPEDVVKLQERALNIAVRIVGLADENVRNKRMLNAVMRRLKDRDGEMYTRIDDNLKQARAVRATTKETAM